MAPLKRPNFDSPSSSSTATDAGKRVKFAPTPSSAAPRSSTSTAQDTPASGPGAGDDLLEDDLEASAKKSRADVIEDGYDSDSSAGSDGGFGVGGGRKGAAKTGADGGEGDDPDDDDMFGPGKDEDASGKEKGKEREFLEMGDIEGQEFGRVDDGVDPDEEEYVPEDDLANTDDAPRGKRSKEGMGYALSSFNMQDELSEGRFAADGSYVQNAADPLANHDSWLTGLSKKEIRAAAESKARREADLRRREEEDGRKGSEQLAQERGDCLIGLLKLVREGETVARALARLGERKKREGGVRVKRVVRPKSGEDVEMTEEGDGEVAAGVAGAGVARAEEDPLAAKIDLLTHLASTLLSTHGELEIYDQSYDDIIKTLKSEGAVRRDWVPPVDPEIEIERQAAVAAKQSALAEQPTAANHSRPLIARKTAAPAAPPPTAEQASARFKYRWVSPPKDQPADTEYGPYTRKELDEWVAGGYFGPAGVAIAVKREGEEEWKSWRETIAA